ncbi:MAG: hypothetical protein HZB53_20290 [Chloroflexi bacterium]|nr:hypothetical protein [Chloroflexota bacterium]
MESIPRDSLISPRRIFSLWWPLAASSLLMSAEMPIINAGMARTPGPEAALAGFAVAATLSNLIEAPMLMLIGASAALSRDRAMVRVMRRFTFSLAIFVNVCYLLISFTPLADVILRQWMGLPPAVADACLPALRILILWPSPTGWRRMHQGILIRMRRTRIISAGTVIRVIFVALMTVLTLAVLRWPAAIGGAAVTGLAVVLEALLATFWANRVLPDMEEEIEPPMRFGPLLSFYVPLVMVSYMSIVSQPLLASGLARAPSPTQSLAAWPTIWSLTGLIGSICYPLQETTIALADRHTLGGIRRFGMALGAAASGLLGVLALTPLAGFYFGQVIGLPADLRALTDTTIVLMIPYPFLMACEVMLRGFLIKQQHTGATRLAMGCYLLVLAASLLTGVALQIGTGAQIAATSILLAISCEVLLLGWLALPVVREMRSAAA